MTEVSKRRQRIREKVPLGELLQAYGYEVTKHGGTQQFRCDLHGDGSDGSPSARYYGEDTWYCFACGKVRDAVTTVMEKEGVEYKKACVLLEKKYGLPMLSNEDDSSNPPSEIDSPIDLRRAENPEERIYKILLMRTRDRVGTPESLLKYWEAYDMLKFKGTATKGQWDKLLGVLLEG